MPTVYKVVVRHIDLLRKPQPGTIAKYRKMAAAHIASSDLGRTPVDKVTKAAVIDWLDQLTVEQGANQTKDQPLSRKTKQNIHALLSAAFVTAMDAETMTRNPAKGVAEADLNEAREAVYLSPEELVMLAEPIDPHYSLFIRFLGGTGLRYSEATALRRRDITVREGRAAVRVSRAWKSKGKGEEIGPPKTNKANRTVTCNGSCPPPLPSTYSSSALMTSCSSARTATTSATPASTRKSGSHSWGSWSAKSWTASPGSTRSATHTPRACSTPASRSRGAGPARARGPTDHPARLCALGQGIRRRRGRRARVGNEEEVATHQE